MSTTVGIDVGTTGVKALAVAEDGEIVGRAEREYGLSTPKPGWAEQDPEDWWQATEAALADLGVDEVAGREVFRALYPALRGLSSSA